MTTLLEECCLRTARIQPLMRRMQSILRTSWMNSNGELKMAR